MDTLRIPPLQLVISEIKDSAATGLLAVKLLAQYLSGKQRKVRNRKARGRCGAQQSVQLLLTQ
jgi:hypothetical protein